MIVALPMGLIYATARMLLAARHEGFDFTDVVTLGRQQVFVGPDEVSLLIDEFGDTGGGLKGSSPKFGEFCEPFLRQLVGSQSVTSIDFSGFEGATIQHDLNQPVDPSMEERFSAVIDGGTIEHVFNVPVALANCMRMTRVGGCVVITTTANNHCGHGLYQFSPELFFRVFQPENGFELCRIVLVQHPFPGAELSENQQFFEVTDPNELRCRVGLVSKHPTLVMVLARRISAVPIFAVSPMQSNYQLQWDAHSTQSRGESRAPSGSLQLGVLARLRRLAGNIKRAVYAKLPVRCQRWLTGCVQKREYSFRNRRFYRPWKR